MIDNNADASVEHLKSVAKSVFDFDNLKDEQIEVMQALLRDHKDVFYAFPTGKGKMILFLREAWYGIPTNSLLEEVCYEYSEWQ